MSTSQTKWYTGNTNNLSRGQQMKQAMLRHFESENTNNDFHTILWSFSPLSLVPSKLKQKITLYDLRTLLVQSGIFVNRNTPADDYITSGHFAFIRSVMAYKGGKTKTANAIYVSTEGIALIQDLVKNNGANQC